MKTKITFLFALLLLCFLAFSEQKGNAAAGRINSHNKSLPAISPHNNGSDVISDPNKIMLQPELDRLLDSVYEFGWDVSWNLNTKEHRYHNSSGWLTEDRYEVKYSGSSEFVNYVHFLYSYGSNSNWVSMVGELWSHANIWVPYEYTHNVKPNLADTSYSKTWNSERQKFIAGTETISRYDAVDSITLELTLKYDTTTNQWVNQYKDSIIYASPHLYSEEIFQAWYPQASTWTNINKKENAYDTNNFLIDHKEYVWNDTAHYWQNSLWTNYSNDLSGNPLISVTKNWNTHELVWDTISQTIYNYNLLEWKLSEREQVFNKATAQFVDYYLTYYTYFTSGILQSTTGNFWKPLTNEWITDSYYIIDSNNNFDEEYHKYHDNVTYEITGGTRKADTYSGKLQLMNILDQEWSKTANDWVNTEQTNYHYNTNKLLDTLLVQNWDTTGNAWLNSRLSVYYYSEPFGINESSMDNNLCLFANPMHSGTVISCPGFTPGEVYTVRIYSLQGRLVYTKTFTGENSFTLNTSVPEGLYMMQFADNRGKILRSYKVVIVK